MKIASTLLFTALVAGFAQASPYIVYSGTATGTTDSASGAARTSNAIYLLTDLADTSNFAILQIDSTDNVYTVISRPSDNPPDGEATDNFFGGIVASNGKSGTSALSFTTSTSDSSNNTFISRGYATGALTLTTTTLVSARTKPLAVTLKTNGAVTGTYSFNSSAAISSGGNAYPKSLSGTFSNYEITSSGPLAHISSGGTLSLSVNSALTTLANIGGGYSVGRNSAAIMPVSIPSGTAADAFAAWLSAFAQANGYSLPTTSSPAGVVTGASLSMGTELSVGAATYSGSVQIVDAASGTLTFTLQNPDNGSLTWSSTASTPGAVVSSSNGILYVGGNGGSSSASGSLSSGLVVNVGNGDVVLNLNSSNVGLTTLTGGTLTLSGGTTTTVFNPEPVTIAAVSATITITAVNSNSTYDGTITSAAGLTANFANGAIVNNSTTSVTVPAPSVGDAIACSVSISGATFTAASSSQPATLTGGTLTITNVTSDTNSSSTSGSGN